uniref:Uncharacterized protein n=1 Tax=Aegilops tauschii subsp. strangulata TaxID=200361 RepID=A0A453GIJ1_AEGTS
LRTHERNGADIRAAALCRRKKRRQGKGAFRAAKRSGRFTLLLPGILIPPTPSSTNHRPCQVRAAVPRPEVPSVVFSFVGGPRRDLLSVFYSGQRDAACMSPADDAAITESSLIRCFRRAAC